MRRTSLLMSLFCSMAVAIGHAQTEPPKSNPQQTAADNERAIDESVKLMRQDIRSQRKQIIAANLPLTDAESTKFWPVYDRYVVDHSKIYDTRYSLIKEYADHYSTLTDAQANDFIKRWTTTEEQMAQLRLRWIPQFEKVISAKKTAMFFQIDRRLGLLVELKLSSEIPLAQP